MPRYTVNASWKMFGHVEIEAESLEDAIEEAGTHALTEFNADYESESFIIDYDSTYDQNEV